MPPEAMPPEPETYNWTQFVGDRGDGLADRMAREALLLLDGLVDGAWDLLDSDEGSEIDLRTCLDSRTAESVAEIEQQAGHALKLREASVGRGASGFGVVVEIAEAIATVGGASAAIALAARGVRTAYHKIARVNRWRPLISLGAAEHLAIADLIDRVYATPQLLGSGDLCSESDDPDFTGGDAFFVVLATDSELHHYHISAYGEIFYIGTSPLMRSHFDEPPPYWADTSH